MKILQVEPDLIDEDEIYEIIYSDGFKIITKNRHFSGCEVLRNREMVLAEWDSDLQIGDGVFESGKFDENIGEEVAELIFVNSIRRII